MSKKLIYFDLYDSSEVLPTTLYGNSIQANVTISKYLAPRRGKSKIKSQKSKVTSSATNDQ
ncbi:hypothetical protein [Nodularia sphaerocarpa]|uniref:hypothetical protein n=1 Tax=Nodularia sphaerocarpa TaxID=137816 RepID=UPI001EFBCB4E|nr:hypothetical protein [Nodularia sphaerocarpa]MDB9373740.1 hypothetical protein [Nodularia sphaerocarpa CS-585]